MRKRAMRRESPALIRSFHRVFRAVRRPSGPSVENFFARRAEGCGPLHRIVAPRICLAGVPRELV